jgi:hypothetical protein
MDIVAFQIPESVGYNPLRLLLAIERDPRVLCAFKARWRVTAAAELVTYLQFLVGILHACGTEAI